jgi:hypothetical protein
MANRRATPRYPTNQRSQITIANSLAAGWVLDVSKTGLRLHLESSVPVGSSIEVDLNTSVVFGQIRYCRPDELDGFEAGIQIETVKDKPVTV